MCRTRSASSAPRKSAANSGSGAAAWVRVGTFGVNLVDGALPSGTLADSPPRVFASRILDRFLRRLCRNCRIESWISGRHSERSALPIWRMSSASACSGRSASPLANQWLISVIRSSIVDIIVGAPADLSIHQTRPMIPAGGEESQPGDVDGRR